MRVLPNLRNRGSGAQTAGLTFNHQKTFGLEPSVWWLFFRRDLLGYDIHRMNDRRWALALHLASHRTVRPHQAAKEVARL